MNIDTDDSDADTDDSLERELEEQQKLSEKLVVEWWIKTQFLKRKRTQKSEPQNTNSSVVHVLQIGCGSDALEQELLKAKVRKANLEVARAEVAAAASHRAAIIEDQNLITLHLEMYTKFQERLKDYMSKPLQERDALAKRVTIMQIKREHEFFKRHGIDVSDEIDESDGASLNASEV
jgi:mannitol-specific phosphotransferase system IIBC component